MSDQPEQTADAITLTEFVAHKNRIPDHHAMPLNLYAGEGAKMTVSQWDELYREMMSKPTGMSKAEWHEKFSANSK